MGRHIYVAGFDRISDFVGTLKCSNRFFVEGFPQALSDCPTIVNLAFGWQDTDIRTSYTDLGSKLQTSYTKLCDLWTFYTSFSENSSDGNTHSPPATLHSLHVPNGRQRLPKWGTGS